MEKNKIKEVVANKENRDDKKKGKGIKRGNQGSNRNRLTSTALKESEIQEEQTKERQEMPLDSDKGSDISPAQVEMSQPEIKDNALVRVSIDEIDRKSSMAALLPKPRIAMTLEFQNVCCYVPAQFEVPGLLAKASKLTEKAVKGCASIAKSGNEDTPKPPKEKQILFNVNGVVRPGKMVAIMGPSGSGKTTFISLLAGRNQARSTGAITYNNRYVPTDKGFKRCLGYVMQDDALYEGLTVYETLYYTALLRLPRKMSDAAKRERVAVIMECLGISKVKDSIVGGFRISRRGISGGEKKRVAIGQELIYNPSVILLDEPTSGLDSTTALSLIHTLHTMAREGNRTIVTTIHQPSSRIYQMLDKLLLFGQGHVLYYGDASIATQYFGEIGYPMPYGMNPADFMLDVASGWNGKSNEGDFNASDPELKLLLEAIATKPVLDAMKKENEEDWKFSQLSLKGSMADIVHSVNGPSYFLMCYVIAVRSLKDRRFERFDGDSLFTIFFMAVLCGLLWWQCGIGASIATLDGALDVTAILFFTVTFLSFNVMFTGIFTFPNEKTMMMKERASGMYPISAFFIGRSFSDLPLDTLLPIIVTTIIYAMVGLKPTVTAFVLTIVVVLLTCYVAGSLGLLMGAWFLNLKRAQSAATILMLTIMLTGGFFVRNIPIWLSWIKFLSYIMYSWNALVTIHLKGRIAPCNDSDSQSPLCDGMLGSATFDNALGMDIGILCLMLTVLRYAVYLALRYGAKP